MPPEPDSEQAPRTLLGLRPPADLAEGTVSLHPATEAAAPARPSYRVISSGWDSEEQESASRTSDLMAALRAGAVLLLVIIALALLLR